LIGAPCAIEVRVAQKPDVRGLARDLGRAFSDDPVTRWMLPDDARRARALPQVFEALTRHHFLAGGALEVASRDGEITVPGGRTM